MRGMERTSPGRRPAVLCVGQATLDHVYTVDDPVVSGHKHRATTALSVGGGVAANASVTVARLGGRATLMGRVGADIDGDTVCAGLEDEGVDTRLVQRDPMCSTPVSAVIVTRGGRRTVINHTPPELFDAEPPPLDGIDADAVLVDGRWRSGTTAAVRFARAASIPCVVDVDRPPAGAAERTTLLTSGSHLVFGEDALAELTGFVHHDDGIHAIADATAAFVAVTLGERGVAWWDGTGVGHLPAFAVDAVDTTAAGDVFHGAFALALADGMTDVDALRFASAASALKCARPGGRSGIPSRPEVESLLDASRRTPQPTGGQ